MEKIALLLSGNIRRFFDKDLQLSNMYKDLVKNQNIDVFIYTDNNDFYYNDVQYFSDNNKEKKLGIPSLYDRRIHTNTQFINYEDSSKIIRENLLNIFNNNLKDLYIEDYNPKLIDNIYDKNNINHNTFMNNNYSCFDRKNALMCQFYKLYKCYNLLINYENNNKFKYNIIIKSRPELQLTDLNNYDIRNFNLNNQIYCYNFDKFISDAWAIGNRNIMDIYCNYYLNISQNMVDQIYCFHNGNNWEIINNIDLKNYREKNLIHEDASDSGEFGLTYLIKKNNYGIYHFNISEVKFSLYK